jgi:hypothetical protein
MFTHDDLKAVDWCELESPQSELELIEFDQCDFDNRGEDYVQIFIGEVSNFPSALSFWISIVRQEVPPGRWLDEYLSMGSTQLIPPGDYEPAVRRLWPNGKAALPVEILFRDSPIQTCKIWLNHCDEAILATFPGYYIAMRWASSA